MFDDPDRALDAVRELERAGVDSEDISIVASNRDDRFANHIDADDYDDDDGGSEAAKGAGRGAATGGLIGAGAGVLAGLGLLAIPGLGPVVAAGWLASAATGAAAGAVAGGAVGGLAGMLMKEGVDEKDAQIYAEAVDRGGAIVTVRAPDERTDMIEAVLERYNPVSTSAYSDRAGDLSGT
jgi:hypothetical protein